MHRFQQLLLAAALVLFAVSVNCAGTVLAGKIAVPLYLDSLLTFAASALGGLWAGIATAILTNLTMYFFDYTMLPFVLCHLLTAVFANSTFRYYRKKYENRPLNADIFLWAGLWSAVSNGILGNLISDALFSSIANPKVDIIVQAIFIGTGSLSFATHFFGIITNLVDKMISAALSFFVYRIVRFVQRRL